MVPKMLRKKTISKVWISPVKWRVIAAIEAQAAVLPIIQSAPRTCPGRLSAECRVIKLFRVSSLPSKVQILVTQRLNDHQVNPRMMSPLLERPLPQPYY
jgi:hypothetical protein